MKWGDLTPLFTVILAVIMIAGTFVLVVSHNDVPDVLKTGDGLVIAFYFVAVGARPAPPPPPPPEGGGK